MKSKLIRLFAVLASVLVLVVALVVPMSADYSSETGWDAPVGTFDPFQVSLPVDIVDNRPVYGDVWVGLPYEIDGISFCFQYIMNFDLSVVPSITESSVLYDGEFICYYKSSLIDDLEGYYICDEAVVNHYTSDYFNICIHVVGMEEVYLELRFDQNEEISFYLLEYPLMVDDYSVWESLSFDVFEVEQISPTEPIGNVWTEIMTWITSGLNSVQGVFYANNQLTMLGTLAVIGVAIAVAFLLIGVLQRFIHLRG